MDVDANLESIGAELARLDMEIASALEQVSHHRGIARALAQQRDAVVNRERVARRLAAMSPQERAELAEQLQALAG